MTSFGLACLLYGCLLLQTTHPAAGQTTSNTKDLIHRILLQYDCCYQRRCPLNKVCTRIGSRCRCRGHSILNWADEKSTSTPPISRYKWCTREMLENDFPIQHWLLNYSVTSIRLAYNENYRHINLACSIGQLFGCLHSRLCIPCRHILSVPCDDIFIYLRMWFDLNFYNVLIFYKLF